MNDMVVGFLFGPTGKAVALVRKERPEWQKGMLNGVGGKVRQGETPYAAMVREFHEETGVHLETGWRRFAVIAIPDGRIFCFLNRSSQVYKVATQTDEHVDVYSAKNFHKHVCVPDLMWLIPMALSVDPKDSSRWFAVERKDL